MPKTETRAAVCAKCGRDIEHKGFLGTSWEANGDDVCYADTATWGRAHRPLIIALVEDEESATCVP